MNIRTALSKCRDQFYFYEKEHREKAERFIANGEYMSAASSLEKADTNKQFAEMASGALSEAQPESQCHDPSQA